ncbi:hypothetical protein IFM89_019757 [Coptis chinensis]|uniref:Uncharacterized protein n=1 Tax=Coptis chinensis TaxID=261450 RepID=A0A835H405_9MAGN|nr:hypothetical protein IFM89_019757 [Coptis chinensis]
MKNLTTFEKALIGSSTGGMAGAFTYVCLLPLDTIKTKLQTKGATQIYKGSVDVIVKTFQAKGILGFYNGISAVIVGSTISSAIYFGTCEFGKLFLSKFSKYPSVLIPPTAGAMGNIVSSAVMVPKELITQRIYLVTMMSTGVILATGFQLSGGNNQLDTLIWYSWLGGIIIGTMIGSNMVLEEHYKAGPRNIVITGRRKNVSGSMMTSLPREIGGAPPYSFVVRLSEIIGSFKTLRKIALFWCRVITEYIMREAGLNTEAAVVSLGSSSALYARVSTGDLVL